MATEMATPLLLEYNKPPCELIDVEGINPVHNSLETVDDIINYIIDNIIGGLDKFDDGEDDSNVQKPPSYEEIIVEENTDLKPTISLPKVPHFNTYPLGCTGTPGIVGPTSSLPEIDLNKYDDIDESIDKISDSILEERRKNCVLHCNSSICVIYDCIGVEKSTKPNKTFAEVDFDSGSEGYYAELDDDMKRSVHDILKKWDGDTNNPAFHSELDYGITTI